jgi:thiosulfate dehydrogenase [quinone] large subunit
VEFNLLDASGKPVVSWDAEDLAAISSEDISNAYVAKVKPGERSLIFPVGARARVSFRDPSLDALPGGSYQIELIDVSGLSWRAPLNIH